MMRAKHSYLSFCDKDYNLCVDVLYWLGYFALIRNVELFL